NDSSNFATNINTGSSTGAVTIGNAAGTVAINAPLTMGAAVDLGAHNVTNGGTITATGFSGPLTGNVTGNLTGNVTGNATSATALQTARTINGVSFDGTA